jgi:proteasomal ATPase-associated factor 1
MSIETLPFVSVQADWENVVREVASNTIPEGSFWIACYLTGTCKHLKYNAGSLNAS